MTALRACVVRLYTPLSTAIRLTKSGRVTLTPVVISDPIECPAKFTGPRFKAVINSMVHSTKSCNFASAGNLVL